MLTLASLPMVAVASKFFTVKGLNVLLSRIRGHFLLDAPTSRSVTDRDISTAVAKELEEIELFVVHHWCSAVFAKFSWF